MRNCIDRATDKTDAITDDASCARKREKETVRNCIDRATDETDVITEEASSA